MERTITVKGTGSVRAKPDYVKLCMTIGSEAPDYDAAIEKAASDMAALREAFTRVGFENSDLKTVSFNVHAQYEAVHQPNSGYKNVFKGFVVNHNVKLCFDLDLKRLSEALAAVSSCKAEPELNITFTVKDQDAVKDELLRSAAENARKKAEVLCGASGVKLRELMSISYDWGVKDIESPSRLFAMQRERGICADPADIDIQPDDIDVKDSATFVWAIE